MKIESAVYRALYRRLCDKISKDFPRREMLDHVLDNGRSLFENNKNKPFIAILLKNSNVTDIRHFYRRFLDLDTDTIRGDFNPQLLKNVLEYLDYRLDDKFGIDTARNEGSLIEAHGKNMLNQFLSAHPFDVLQEQKKVDPAYYLKVNEDKSHEQNSKFDTDEPSEGEVVIDATSRLNFRGNISEEQLTDLLKRLSWYYKFYNRHLYSEKMTFNCFRTDVTFRQQCQANITEARVKFFTHSWSSKFFENDFHVIELKDGAFLKTSFSYSKNENIYEENGLGFSYKTKFTQKATDNDINCIVLNYLNLSLKFEKLNSTETQLEFMHFSIDEFNEHHKDIFFGHKITFDLKTHAMAISFVGSYCRPRPRLSVENGFQEMLTLTDEQIPPLIRAALSNPNDIIIEPNPYRDLHSNLMMVLAVSPYYKNYFFNEFK